MITIKEQGELYNDQRKKKENGLEQLAEGLGINLDADMLGKVAGAAQGLMKDVNLDKLGDSVKDVMNNANIKEMLEKTDIDDNILEKGKDLLGGLLAEKTKNKSKLIIQKEPSKFEGSFFDIPMVIPCSFDMTVDDPIGYHQAACSGLR